MHVPPPLRTTPTSHFGVHTQVLAAGQPQSHQRRGVRAPQVACTIGYQLFELC